MSSPEHTTDTQDSEEEVQPDSDSGSSGDASMVDGIRAMRDGEFATVEELQEAENEERE